MASQADLLSFVQKIAADGEIQKILADGIDGGDIDNLLRLAEKYGLTDVAPKELQQVLENYQGLDQGVIGSVLKKFFG